MARLVGPDEGSWLAYVLRGDNSMGSAAGLPAVVSLARAYANPTGISREAIDDYSVAYEVASAAMDASPHLKAALRRQYSRRAGLVRIG